MSFQLKNRLEISLFFNEKEFPFDRVNTLNFLHMSASTRIGVPMLHVSVTDSVNWISKNTVLADGVPIKIILKIGSDKVTYLFRVNLVHSERSSAGTYYSIDGYLDVPRYWLQAADTPFKGSSNDALKKVCDSVGLTFKGTPTADSQLWLPRGERFHQYARKICNHGYRDERSCMQMAVILAQEMRYVDVSTPSPIKGVFRSAEYKQGSFIATDYKPKSFSGLMNALSGYASEIYTSSVDSSDTQKTDSVVFRKQNLQLAMNAILHKGIERAAIQFRPIDCGNVHSKFEEASYQNTRISNLFSQGLELVTPEQTKVEPLDWVSFEANLPNQDKEYRPLSGQYLVASKAVFVQGINYFEKFELFRTGVEAQIVGQV